MAAHRHVRKKKQLVAEGWPQILEKTGMKLFLKWPPPKALLLHMARYLAPSKQECEPLVQKLGGLSGPGKQAVLPNINGCFGKPVYCA